jgi:hypothetical protein
MAVQITIDGHEAGHVALHRIAEQIGRRGHGERRQQENDRQSQQ